MITKKVLFVTGAGRGLGIDIAKAALAAGHAVVATGRNTERVSAALGAHDDLLVVKLDVTSLDDAKAAARAAVDRFGRIDVLVNNAGNFYAGFVEEIRPQDFRSQIETTLFGPVNVTRAVLPVMRAQRSGLVVAISSTAGIVGQEFCTAYAAAKLGDALVQLASQDEPPRRFAAGADAVAAVEQKATDLLTQAGAYRELSSNLAHDDAAAA